MILTRSREELRDTYSKLEENNDETSRNEEWNVRQYMVQPFIIEYLNLSPIDYNRCRIESFNGIGSNADKKKKHPDYHCNYNEMGTHFVIEVKSWKVKKKNLIDYELQLKSYMDTDVKIKIGILTNGNTYRIYKRDNYNGGFNIPLICEFDFLDDEYAKFYLNSIFAMARCKMSDLAIKLSEYEFHGINAFRDNNIELTEDVYAKICANHHKDKFEEDDYEELSTTITSTKECDNENPYVWSISDTSDAFSKTIEFKNEHSLNINEYIPSTKYHSILLCGNLIGICGQIKNGKLVNKLSKTEKQNIEFFKRNHNATFTVIGTNELYNYFLELFACINIDNLKKHLKFLSINNGADFKKTISLLKDNNMKFDVAIVNPPYKGMLYIDIILAMLPYISKHYVGVHPLTYCMYSQSNEKRSLELKRIMSNYETHIYIKNPLEYFPYEAYIGQIFGISHIDLTQTSKLYLNEIKKDSFDNIQSYADGNEVLLEMSKIMKSYSEKDNFTNHIYSTETAKYKKLPTKTIDGRIYVIRITRSSGSQNNYYSKTSKTLIIASGKENPITKFKDFDGDYYIETGTSSLKIAERIKETLKTDFMRMTMFVTKPTNELVSCIANPDIDVMRLMPWFDWTDKMFDGTYQEINERLFKKYIPENIREKLKAVLAKELPSVY